MKLIIRNCRIIATATDEYYGPEEFIDAPENFDMSMISAYRVIDNQLSIDEATRIDMLWQAAHNYEYARISGSAIGILAMGVIQNKPKSLAVQTWINGIWNIYYTRKTTGSIDTDFTSAGPLPYTVPEIMEELGI